MSQKLVPARIFVNSFLIFAFIGSICVLFYFGYDLHHRLTGNKFILSLWPIKFIIILPVWLLLTFYNLSTRKTTGIVQAGATAVLLVPGVYVLLRLLKIDSSREPSHYLIFGVSLLLSIMLLVNLKIIAKKEHHHFHLSHYLLALFITFSFIFLNFIVN